MGLTRRTLLRALAGLPVVGAMIAKRFDVKECSWNFQESPCARVQSSAPCENVCDWDDDGDGYDACDDNPNPPRPFPVAEIEPDPNGHGLSVGIRWEYRLDAPPPKRFIRFGVGVDQRSAWVEHSNRQSGPWERLAC